MFMQDAQLWPGDTTKSHLLTQLGLRVNGPVSGVLAVGCCCSSSHVVMSTDFVLRPQLFHGGLLLTAVDKSGRPCIVKL